MLRDGHREKLGRTINPLSEGEPVGKDGSGRLAIVRVNLCPQVRFGGEKTPTPEELAQMHDQAHHTCFIANSVRTKVVVESA